MRMLRTGLAGMLVSVVACMGLVISTAPPAAALQSPINLGAVSKTGLQKGVVIGVGGATLFGRTSNPAGWALTIGQLAWWGYSNRDAIIDFLHGPDTPHTLEQWLAMHPGDTPASWASSGSDSRIAVEIVSVSGSTVNYKVSCTRTRLAFGLNYQCLPAEFSTLTPETPEIDKEFRCHNRTTGVDSSVHGLLQASVDLNLGPQGSVVTKTETMTPCGTGSDVTGILIPPQQAGPSAPRQTFGLGWGDVTLLLPELPEGEVGFERTHVTARCKNAVTGETTTIDSTSTMLGEWTTVLPSCKAHLGDDWYGTGVTIAPEAPEIDNEPIPDEIEVPDFPPFDWDELIPDEDDPDWQPCYGTKKGCALDVWIDNDPCDEGVPVCTKWTTVLEKDPERVKCMFGAVEVAMKFCAPLAHVYDPGTEVHQDTGTKAPPTGDTDTDTGTETGTHTTPEDGQKPKPSDENDQITGKCFPSGWGLFNPVEWVYKPVKCALEWAFVPPTSFSVRMSRMRDMLEGRAPFSWVGSLATLPTAIPGSGCPDWRIKVKSVDKNILCGTPFGNAMVSARPVFAVLMVGAAVYPLLRSVMYASFPLVKPSPTS